MNCQKKKVLDKYCCVYKCILHYCFRFFKMYKYFEHLCLPVQNESTYLFTFTCILYLLKHTVPTDTEEKKRRTLSFDAIKKLYCNN